MEDLRERQRQRERDTETETETETDRQTVTDTETDIYTSPVYSCTNSFFSKLSVIKTPHPDTSDIPSLVFYIYIYCFRGNPQKVEFAKISFFWFPEETPEAFIVRLLGRCPAFHRHRIGSYPSSIGPINGRIDICPSNPYRKMSQKKCGG